MRRQRLSLRAPIALLVLVDQRGATRGPNAFGPGAYQCCARLKVCQVRSLRKPLCRVAIPLGTRLRDTTATTNGRDGRHVGRTERGAATVRNPMFNQKTRRCRWRRVYAGETVVKMMRYDRTGNGAVCRTSVRWRFREMPLRNRSPRQQPKMPKNRFLRRYLYGRLYEILRNRGKSASENSRNPYFAGII